jgi:hypothetical protein
MVVILKNLITGNVGSHARDTTSTEDHGITMFEEASLLYITMHIVFVIYEYVQL